MAAAVAWAPTCRTTIVMTCVAPYTSSDRSLARRAALIAKPRAAPAAMAILMKPGGACDECPRSRSPMYGTRFVRWKLLSTVIRFATAAIFRGVLVPEGSKASIGELDGKFNEGCQLARARPVSTGVA